MIRRIYNEKQQRNEEAALLSESKNRSQEHEALVASAGEGDQFQSGMDIDLNESKPLIPLSDEHEHAQRTSTSTQSLVSSREFRTDESGGGNDLDQLNEDLEDDDSDRYTDR